LATRFITCFAGQLGIAGPADNYTSDQWNQIILRFADSDNFQKYAQDCFDHVASDLQSYFDTLSLVDQALVELRSWVTSWIKTLRYLAKNFTPPPAYNDYVEFVRSSFGIRQRLLAIFQRDPKQIASGLSAELANFLGFYKKALIHQAQTIAAAAALKACTDVAGLVLAFAAITTPEPPEGALTCAADPNKPGISASPDLLKPLGKICSDIREVLLSVTALIGSLDNIVPSPDGVRADELTKLRQLLVRRKAELLDLVQSLAATVSSAAGNINDVLGAWRTFFGTLTPAQAVNFQAWIDQRTATFCQSPDTFKINVEQARTLGTKARISLDQTTTAFAGSLEALKKVQDGWHLEEFTDQTIKAAIEGARLEFAIRIADISNRLLQLLVQQTSSFEAAAQGETDKFRRSAKQAFKSNADSVVTQLAGLSDSVKDAANKVAESLKAWQDELAATRPVIEAYIKKTAEDLKQAQEATDAARSASSASEKIDSYATAAARIANLLGYKDDFAAAKNHIDNLQDTLEETIQEQLYSLLDLGTALEGDVIEIVLQLADPMLNILDGAYNVVKEKRAQIERKVNSDDALKILDKFFFNIHNVLYVNENDDTDQIQQDEIQIAHLRSQAAGGNPLAAEDVETLVTIVAPATSSLVTLFNQIMSASEAVLRLDLARFIDFAEIRKTVESEIKALVPSDVALSYAYSTEFSPQGSLKELFDLWEYEEGIDKFWQAVGPSTEENKRDNFVIKANTHINILTGARSARVEGYFQPFQIKLFTKAFDVVTLFFDGANFKSVDGGKPVFHTSLVQSKLGAEVEFLKQLETWLCAGRGSGLFINFTTQPVFGLEAGYRFGLPVISIGTVSFINVGLEASVMLPFEPGDAIFHVALSSRDNPFIISAAPYGGGGHIGLYANARKIVGVEASFEFGGVAAFAFGPLSGIGRITTGIFVSTSEARGASIQGHFFAGGSARIWIFGISTSLTVRMGQANGGSMCGSAVYSFAFSYGLDDIEFHVPVWRQEGKGFSGDGSRADNSDYLALTRFAQSTDNDVSAAINPDPPMPPTELSKNATEAEREEWQQKWDTWKSANREQTKQQQLNQLDAAKRRLDRVKQYGIKITSKVATREHAWRSYRNYFDDKLTPED
jgi:hypothetical protein